MNMNMPSLLLTLSTIVLWTAAGWQLYQQQERAEQMNAALSAQQAAISKLSQELNACRMGPAR